MVVRLCGDLRKTNPLGAELEHMAAYLPPNTTSWEFDQVADPSFTYYMQAARGRIHWELITTYNVAHSTAYNWGNPHKPV